VSEVAAPHGVQALLDPRQVARRFGAAAATYDAAAWLQGLARDELLSRLDLLQAPPARVLDLGAGTGLAARRIKRHFPRAVVIAADIAAPMLAVARSRSRFWRRIHCVQADAQSLPFADASFDLVFSNLMLQWLVPPDIALAGISRVLKPGGLLLASSFGPETLRELRAAWGAADAGAHVHEFIDVHDLGSALSRAGFAETVLDVDRHVRHYAGARALMQELRALGARNLDARRARGLTGRGAFARMNAAYETLRTPAGLPATWQLVHAVAWAQPPRGGHAGEMQIALAEVRARLAQRRG